MTEAEVLIQMRHLTEALIVEASYGGVLLRHQTAGDPVRSGSPDPSCSTQTHFHLKKYKNWTQRTQEEDDQLTRLESP